MPDVSVRLQQLAKFSSRLRNRGEFGEMQSAPYSLGYVSFGKTGQDFVEMAYETGWIERDFRWMDWNGTAEAMRLRQLDEVKAATEPEMARILTALIRGDRFCEGLLLGAYDSGLLLALSERAATLIAERH